jgi:light-regulated signal transduction histidine kinase (bacteriophytochrome)
MERISRAETVQQLCRIAAEEIKALSGFDKVMIYQFDKDWNGEVIAEVMEPGMDAYMGLKFPASDIPKPARDMYTTNPYRFIPNREYQPVHLYPLLNPITHSFTNLIASELRSVAGVHLEYLKNMEVTASMSTRILLNGKLWGLIACHHRTAKYLSFEQCFVFEILSELISSRITALISSDVLKRQDRLNKNLLAFVERIYPYQNIVDAVRENKEDLMQFLSAEGLVLTWNEHIEKAGSTPGDIELDVLRYWLQGRLNGSVYHEPALPAVMDDAQTYAAQASGLLVLPLDSSRGNFILLFRPEVLKKQDWGGNPDEAIRFEKNNTVYHPRHSFDSWQEVVRNTAQPWSDDEIAAAETLKNIMVELSHRH